MSPEGIEVLQSATMATGRRQMPRPAVSGIKMLLIASYGFVIATYQVRPYFFILRHREARSIPRILAALVRTPPVSLRTWVM